MYRLFLGLALGIFLLNGCGDTLKNMESPYMITVTGTENLKFSGYCFFAGTSGVIPHDVSGTIPVEYTEKGVASNMRIPQNDSRRIVES